MRYLGFCVYILVLVVGAPLARGGEPRGGGDLLTIDEAVLQALAENPGLQASEALVQAQKARISIERSLDEPMAGVEFYDVPINTTDITQGMETNYSFVQKFPFPSKLATKSGMAKKKYWAQKNIYENAKISVRVETEHAFHDLYYLERALKINRELQGLFQKLVSSLEAGYATTHEPSQNFLKARVELEKLQSEAAMLEARQVGAQARLNILRHRHPSEPVRLAELPNIAHAVPAYKEFEKRMLTSHPELKASEFSAAAAKSNVTLARQELVLPDFQTRFTYAERYALQDAWTGEVMINIPFLWGKRRKEIQESVAMRRAAERELASVRNDRLAMLGESYANWESSKKSHQIFRGRVLPHAALALQSARSIFETSPNDFLSLIDAARTFKEAKLGELEARVEVHKALTHLKLALGEDFLMGKNF